MSGNAWWTSGKWTYTANLDNTRICVRVPGNYVSINGGLMVDAFWHLKAQGTWNDWFTVKSNSFFWLALCACQQCKIIHKLFSTKISGCLTSPKYLTANKPPALFSLGGGGIVTLSSNMLGLSIVNKPPHCTQNLLLPEGAFPCLVTKKPSRMSEMCTQIKSSNTFSVYVSMGKRKALQYYLKGGCLVSLISTRVLVS